MNVAALVHVVCEIQDEDYYWSLRVIIPPASTKLIGGYTGITLSVCPSVDRIVSALYLQQFSPDPFHICTSYQATSEGVSRVMPVSKFKNLKFWRIFKICNFDFVIFWLGIQYDSMVWVIMRRRGVSSERRRSSCSSSPTYGHQQTDAYEIIIDRRATRLDSLPSTTQFLPRSGPWCMRKVAHWAHQMYLTTQCAYLSMLRQVLLNLNNNLM